MLSAGAGSRPSGSCRRCRSPSSDPFGVERVACRLVAAVADSGELGFDHSRSIDVTRTPVPARSQAGRGELAGRTPSMRRRPPAAIGIVAATRRQVITAPARSIRPGSKARVTATRPVTLCRWHWSGRRPQILERVSAARARHIDHRSIAANASGKRRARSRWRRGRACRAPAHARAPSSAVSASVARPGARDDDLPAIGTRRRAVAAPMPAVAPVMNAVLVIGPPAVEQRIRLPPANRHRAWRARRRDDRRHRGSAICAGGVPRALFREREAWGTGKSSTNAGALAAWRSMIRRAGAPLPPRLHTTSVCDAVRGELLDPQGCASSPGGEDDVSRLRRSGPRLDRAGTIVWRCISWRKNWSKQGPHALFAQPFAAVLTVIAPPKLPLQSKVDVVASSSQGRNASPCVSDFVAVCDQQGRFMPRALRARRPVAPGRADCRCHSDQAGS